MASGEDSQKKLSHRETQVLEGEAAIVSGKFSEAADLWTGLRAITKSLHKHSSAAHYSVKIKISKLCFDCV